MLHWIIDGVLLLILLGCAWKGFRDGLIPGIFMLVALYVSFYCASLFASTYSNEFTSMLEPFASGLTDRSMRAAEAVFEEAGKEPSVEELAREGLRQLGILDSAAEHMVQELVSQVNEGGPALRAAMVNLLCDNAAYVLMFTISFILVAIAFVVIGNLINLSFHFPGLELVDSLVGVIFGIAEGLVIIAFLAWLLRFSGLLIKESVMQETILLRWLMSVSPLPNLLGL